MSHAGYEKMTTDGREEKRNGFFFDIFDVRNFCFYLDWTILFILYEVN
jgi:hypothetical protein